MVGLLRVLALKKSGRIMARVDSCSSYLGVEIYGEAEFVR
jgi:hypothetical protein